MPLRHRESLFWLAIVVMAAAGFWWAGKSREPQSTPGHKVITWIVFISPMRDYYEQEVAEYERQHPGVEVRVIWVPASEYNMKFKTLAAAGQTPDLFYSGDVWAAYLRPFTADITPYVQRDAAEIGLDDYFPVIRAAMQHEGKYFVVPEMVNVSLLYYNRGLFRAAGVAEPTADWTWDDLVRAGQKLTRPATAKDPGVWGCARMEGWWGEWLTYIRQAGGTVFSPDGRRCVLDSPAAITGLRFYLEKASKYHISAPGGFAVGHRRQGDMAALAGQRHPAARTGDQRRDAEAAARADDADRRARPRAAAAEHGRTWLRQHRRTDRAGHLQLLAADGLQHWIRQHRVCPRIHGRRKRRDSRTGARTPEREQRCSRVAVRVDGTLCRP